MSSEQGPWDRDAYGQPPHPADPRDSSGRLARPRNGMGTAALVLGILAVLSSWTAVGGIVLGILAVILGLVGRRRVKRREADNGGMAVAGIVLGAIGLVIGIGAAVLLGLLISGAVNSDLVRCLRDAGGDQSRIDICRQQFTNRNG